MIAGQWGTLTRPLATRAAARKGPALDRSGSIATCPPRGLPGPGRHQKRVPEPPEREQHQRRVRELLVPERRQAQVQVQVQRHAVVQVLPKGSLK